MTNYSNTAVQTTLASAIDDNDTSLTVADATGYPSAPFHIVVDPGSTTAEEVMLVTGVAGTTFTVQRAYDGTTGKAHSSGATVIHAVVAADLSGRYTSAEVDDLLLSYLLSTDFTWTNIGGKPTTLAGYGITDAASDGDLAAHEADTTGVHGIANTSALILDGDPRLSDARTPTGGAGGVLSGTYPNPGFAVDMAEQGELDAHINDTTGVHGVTDTADLVRRASAATAGRLPFFSAGDTVSHDSNLTWDNTAKQLTVPAIVTASGAIDITALGAAVDTIIELGAATTGNRAAAIDFHGDSTYTDYGLRIRRGSSGANTTSDIIQRGTGTLQISTTEAAAIAFLTNNTLRLTIGSNGEFVHGGTSFPTSPSTGARFFRTDLGFECYYDGTRWLTVQEYSVARHFDAPLTGVYVAAPLRGTPYVTHVARVIGTGATNNGSNYWTITVYGVNATQGATTVIDATTTAAQSGSTYATPSGAPSATATPANNASIDVGFGATGAPSTLVSASVMVHYRLIVT